MPDTDDRTWQFEPGDELAPGLRAWALLGDGPRCETWLAWDAARWCAVAVKLPHPGELGCGRAEAALAREAGAAAGLAHPALQRLLDARLDARLPHLVFEYAEGPTLEQLLDEDGPLDEVDVLLVGAQLAAALHYLHGRGLVHLDLKPGNAVLRDGRLVLIDLGIARRADEPPGPGRVRGTPPYMAPEQEAGEPAAPGMDLFALGVLLHELATGERPGGQAAPHGALGEVARRLLLPDPAERPAAAGEVLGALVAALPGSLPGDERPWPVWADRLLGAGEPAMAGPAGR